MITINYSIYFLGKAKGNSKTSQIIAGLRLSTEQLPPFGLFRIYKSIENDASEPIYFIICLENREISSIIRTSITKPIWLNKVYWKKFQYTSKTKEDTNSYIVPIFTEKIKPTTIMACNKIIVDLLCKEEL